MVRTTIFSVNSNIIKNIKVSFGFESTPPSYFSFQPVHHDWYNILFNDALNTFYLRIYGIGPLR